MPTKASALPGWPYYCTIATSRKKSRKNKNFSRSGKTFDIVKVSESGNHIFRLQFISFTWRWWNAFRAEKDEKYAAKQAKRSRFYTLCPTCVVVAVKGFRCKCFLPYKEEKSEEAWEAGFAPAIFIKPVAQIVNRDDSTDFNRVKSFFREFQNKLYLSRFVVFFKRITYIEEKRSNWFRTVPRNSRGTVIQIGKHCLFFLNICSKMHCQKSNIYYPTSGVYLNIVLADEMFSAKFKNVLIIHKPIDLSNGR